MKDFHLDKTKIEEEEIIVEQEPEILIQLKYQANGTTNVRKEPSLYSEIVGTVQDKGVIEVIEEKDGWLHTKDGWTMKQFYKQV